MAAADLSGWRFGGAGHGEARGVGGIEALAAAGVMGLVYAPGDGLVAPGVAAVGARWVRPSSRTAISRNTLNGSLVGIGCHP